MKKIIYLSFCFILHLVISAQEDVLYIESNYNPRKKIIVHPGEVISIYVTNSNEEITGTLKEITRTHLTVDSSLIPITDIRIIKTYHNRKVYKKLLFGGVILTSGVVVATGFILIFNAIHAGAPAVFYLLPGGLLLDIAGIQVISWASTRLFSKGSIHYIGEDWMISIKKNER